MLKIREDVDLSVLEDYGFYEVNNTCYECVLFNDINQWGDERTVSLLVYQKDFLNAVKNQLCLYVYCFARNVVDETLEIDELFDCDTLFRLIKDGLVVKVNDK